MRDPIAFPVEDVMLLDPRALERLWSPSDSADDARPAVETVGGVAVVRIEGPLFQRANWMFDGYDAIESRFAAALASPAPAVVLLVNSPGGYAAGNFEAARRMREAASAAGKPVVAYVDEMACSAAYALAVVADRIVVPRSGSVGSVGVVATVSNRAKLNASLGVHVHIAASGEQKADLSPEVPFTEAALARLQSRVDGLATQFFEWVGARRSQAPSTVAALQAAVLHGEAAVTAGLADLVGGLDQAFSLAREPAAPRASTTAGKPARGAHMQSILALLGLPETATEHDAASAVAKATDAQRQILALTGAPSFDAALGAIHGYMAEAAKVPALAAQVAEVKAADARRERSAILDAAVSDGRMAPSERASYESGPLAAAPIEFVRASLEARTATAPLVKTAPVAPAGGPPAASLDEETLHIAAAMGLDRAKLAAHLAAEVK